MRNDAMGESEVSLYWPSLSLLEALHNILMLLVPFQPLGLITFQIVCTSSATPQTVIATDLFMQTLHLVPGLNETGSTRPRHPRPWQHGSASAEQVPTPDQCVLCV